MIVHGGIKSHLWYRTLFSCCRRYVRSEAFIDG